MIRGTDLAQVLLGQTVAQTRVSSRTSPAVPSAYEAASPAIVKLTAGGEC